MLETKPSDDTPRVESSLQWLHGAVLEGANRLADTSAVTATLRMPPETPELGALAKRFLTLLPEMDALLRTALGKAEGRGGLAVAKLVADVAQALQRRVDCRSEVTGAWRGVEPGIFFAAAQSEYPDVGMLAIGLATRLVADAWVSLADANPTQHLEVFERFAKGHLAPPVRRATARAARARGIPWEVLFPGDPGILSLGTGYLQVRTELTTTNSASLIDTWMTSNKPLSNALQRRMGVPVPRQITALSADAAVQAAETIGYPVVVKPWRGFGGHGVSANLTHASQVRDAFVRAGEAKVAVEECLPGEDYRLLYMKGEYVAACKRNPPHVIGDGRQTILELMAEQNKTRVRPDGFFVPLHEYEIDDEVLRLLTISGFTPDSIPAVGQRVVLSSAANGGTTTDATAIMHPDNIAAGARAARVSGIDVCGIDFLLPDPTRSYKETGGGICEVNTNPSPQVHIIADGGCNFAVVDKLVDCLVPPPGRGTIPVGVLFGAPPGLSAKVGQLLGTKGVAICTPSGVVFEDSLVTTAPPPWPASARLALLDPGAHFAILEVSSGRVLQHGLFVESCEVVVLGDPDEALDDGHAVALRVASTVVAWAQALATFSGRKCTDTIACAARPEIPGLAEHVEQGGRAVIADGATLTFRQGATEISQVALPKLDEEQVRGWVLAAATAWGLGCDPKGLTPTLRELTLQGKV